MTDSEKSDMLINKVSGTGLTLDNQTNRSIPTIAERFLDLSRKLDES